MKKFKIWQKSGQNFKEYMKDIPCEVDEEMYNHFAEWSPASYQDGEGFMQSGECSRKIKNTEYYETFRILDGKFYYLGDMPAFMSEEVIEEIDELKREIKSLKDSDYDCF